MNFNNGNVNNNNKNNNSYWVRAVLAFTLKPMKQKQMTENCELFAPEETGGISLEEVFEAYFACRRKKRGTYNALAFEADYERKCIRLWREINAGTYKPSRSVAFIVFKPLLEAEFIDDSYSTRKEKGTLYGIRRVEGFVREWLAANGLTLHPRKMYLQHYGKGIPYIGGVVKPGRTYISNRTVGCRCFKPARW